MSFLRVFSSILHAIEAAAVIAAPVVKIMDPTIGNLMTMATTAAVGVEAAITTPNSGQQRADAVAGQTSAVIGVINGLLASQNKPPLPANTGEVVAGQVKTVVTGLNTVADTVDPTHAMEVPAAAGQTAFTRK